MSASTSTVVFSIPPILQGCLRQWFESVAHGTGQELRFVYNGKLVDVVAYGTAPEEVARKMMSHQCVFAGCVRVYLVLGVSITQEEAAAKARDIWEFNEPRLCQVAHSGPEDKRSVWILNMDRHI